MNEPINATLLYLVTGNYTQYYLLIKIINISNLSIIVNMTQISHNVILSYIVSYPYFMLFFPNVTSNNITTYQGIEVNVIYLHGFTIYVDMYNGLVIHYIGNGENVTLIGASIPLAPGVYKPIPYSLLYGNVNYSIYEYETLFLTSVLIVSFYLILERLNKR